MTVPDPRDVQWRPPPTAFRFPANGAGGHFNGHEWKVEGEIWKNHQKGFGIVSAHHPQVGETFISVRPKANVRIWSGAGQPVVRRFTLQSADSARGNVVGVPATYFLLTGGEGCAQVLNRNGTLWDR